MINIKLEAHSVEEWRELVPVFMDHVREWKVPVSVSASGTPLELKEGDKRVAGTGHLMAHGYANYGDNSVNCSHSISLVSNCLIPPRDKWICHKLRDDLLEEGYAVMPQDDTKVTHLFHRGPYPDSTSGMRYISFAARTTDENAVAMLLRDFGGVRLMRIDSGVYISENHP